MSLSVDTRASFVSLNSRKVSSCTLKIEKLSWKNNGKSYVEASESRSEKVETTLLTFSKRFSFEPLNKA